MLPFCNVVVAVVAFSNASSLCFTLALGLCLLSPAVRVYYWYLLNEWIVRAPRHSHIFAHALHEAAAASTAAFAAPLTRLRLSLVVCVTVLGASISLSLSGCLPFPASLVPSACVYILRLKSKRFYIVIVMTARRRTLARL